MIDSEEALHALLSKWVIKALELGCSSPHLLLRYRILKIKPNKKKALETIAILDPNS